MRFGESDDVIFSVTDPTSFSAACSGVDNWSRTTVGLELSYLQDGTLKRKQIASFSPV
jgi:hypothetical protein